MPRGLIKFMFFKYLPIFIVLLLHTTTSKADDTDLSEVKNQVLSAFESLIIASKSLDPESYFQHFDKNKFIGLNSDGTNWNSIDELVPLIIGGFDSINKVNHLEFTNVKVSVIDLYTAILVNEYKQSITLKNGSTINLAGGGAQVWSKHSGQWKLVSVSASNKPNISLP